MHILIDIIGWTGSFGVLAAYGLNSYKVINPDSWSFLLLNTIGAIFLVIYTIYYAAYANTFINVVWVLIAIPAIIKLYRKKFLQAK